MSTNTSSERWLTAHAVMDKLKVSRRTLAQWVRTGVFPAAQYRDDAPRRWSEQVVTHWISTQPRQVNSRRKRGYP